MTYMGYVDGSIPKQLILRQATRLLREHHLDWGLVEEDAAGGDVTAQRILGQKAETLSSSPIRLDDLAAYLGY